MTLDEFQLPLEIRAVGVGREDDQHARIVLELSEGMLILGGASSQQNQEHKGQLQHRVAP